jgi:hypothetical protein
MLKMMVVPSTRRVTTPPAKERRAARPQHFVLLLALESSELPPSRMSKASESITFESSQRDRMAQETADMKKNMDAPIRTFPSHGKEVS